MTQRPSSSGPFRVLTVGASYGLLPSAKIAAAGHAVTVVGRADEVAAIARDGVAVQFSDEQVLRPPMGRKGLTLATPEAVNPQDFDLIVFAVQEPQVHTDEIRNLLARIGDTVPVASIMNMPPPPFLARVPALPDDLMVGAYRDLDVWRAIPAARMTLASPDPQAFRPDPKRPGLLQVTLASNFKFAPFEDTQDQEILASITRDASRVNESWGRPPVHLLAKGSLFTPLSKWPMLVTGNCRCVQAAGDPISIKDAVSHDVVQSQMLYEAVNSCLASIGAPASALVPFESYQRAAALLTRPSSLARGLAAGATAVERVDVLILNLLKTVSGQSEAVALMQSVSGRISTALAQNQS